jgi:hypothetical protein
MSFANFATKQIKARPEELCFFAKFFGISNYESFKCWAMDFLNKVWETIFNDVYMNFFCFVNIDFALAVDLSSRVFPFNVIINFHSIKFYPTSSGKFDMEQSIKFKTLVSVIDCQFIGNTLGIRMYKWAR